MKSTFVIFFSLSLLVISCGKESKSAEELLASAKKNYDSGDYFKAREYLARAIKLKPSDKEIIYQMGKTYAAQNMFDSAFASLSRADKLYPNDRPINQLLHEMSVKTEHWQAARDALLSLARTGDSIEQYYRPIAEYAMRDSTGQVAFYYYGKLIEQYPESLNFYLNQAAAAIMQGEPQNSIDVLKAANKKFGDRAEILSGLASSYGSMGNLTEAEKIYRLLITKDSSVVYQLQLAMTLALSDKKSKKEEAYAMFKDLRLKTANFARVDSILATLKKDLNK